MFCFYTAGEACVCASSVPTSTCCPSVRLGVSTSCGCRMVKLTRYIGRTVSQPALLSNPERGHTTRQSCQLTKREKEVRTLMAQTGSDLWMSVNGNKSVLREKMSDWSAVVSDACELISIPFFFSIFFLRRLVRAVRGFITVTSRTLTK